MNAENDLFYGKKIEFSKLFFCRLENVTDSHSSESKNLTLRKWRCFLSVWSIYRAYSTFECVSMTVCEKLCFEHLPLEYVLLIVYDKHAKLYGHIVLFLFRTFLLHWKRQTLHSICVLNLFFFIFVYILLIKVVLSLVTIVHML